MTYLVHPTSKLVEVRRLVAAGWSQRAVAERVGVTRRTVGRWTTGEAKRRAKVERREWLLARAEQLRVECGVSYSSLARILALDYGWDVSPDTLRHHLRLRGVPRVEARVTDPERKNLQVTA